MAGLDRVDDEASPGPGEPLTLTEAKDWLRVDHTDEDETIGALISAARSAVEAFVKQSLMLTTWTYRIDGSFPWEIRLPVGPLRTTSGLVVQYVDDSGVTQTLSSSVYQVSLGLTGIIRPAYGQTWPSVRSQMDAVTVTFKAGETSIDDVKPAIMHGLRMFLADMYEHRETIVIGASAQRLPMAVQNLLTPFVRHD